MREEEELGKPEEEPTVEDPLNPVRQPNEKFWAYKERMKMVNKILKARSRGLLVWDVTKHGSYVKPKQVKA